MSLNRKSWLRISLVFHLQHLVAGLLWGKKLCRHQGKKVLENNPTACYAAMPAYGIWIHINYEGMQGRGEKNQSHLQCCTYSQRRCQQRSFPAQKVQKARVKEANLISKRCQPGIDNDT